MSCFTNKALPVSQLIFVFSILHGVKSGIFKTSATMSNLPSPPQMNFNANNLPEAWRRWEQSFLNYFSAASLSKKPKTTQAAILMHCAGPDAIDLRNTFNFTGEGEDKRITTRQSSRSSGNSVKVRRTQCLSGTNSGRGNSSLVSLLMHGSQI